MLGFSPRLAIVLFSLLFSTLNTRVMAEQISLEMPSNPLNWINYTHANYGFDQGIILNPDFSAWRNIELNPKATGQHDRYLVKDTMTVGMRLGIGVVIGLSTKKKRNYTLIYPAASSSDARWSRNFLIDLLLPFRVMKNDLPSEYVLIVEDSVDMEGRIRLGQQNQPFTLSTQTTVSNIELRRTFISKKLNAPIKAFNDESVSSKLQQDFSMTFFNFYGLNFLQMSFEHGELNRHFYHFDDQNFEQIDALDAIIRKNDYSVAQGLNLQRGRIQDFFEQTRDNSDIGLMMLSHQFRVDLFQSLETQDDKQETALYQGVQLTEDTSHQNRLPISKNYRARFLLSADVANPINVQAFDQGAKDPRALARDLKFTDPYLTLMLQYTDHMGDDEFEREHLPLMRRMGMDMNQGKSAKAQNFDESPRGDWMFIYKFFLNAKTLDYLLTLRPEDFWQTFAEQTRRPVSYWQMALKASQSGKYFPGLDNNYEGQRFDFLDLYLVERLNDMINAFKQARKTSDVVKKYHKVMIGMRRCFMFSNKNLYPQLFGTFNALLKNHLYWQVAMIKRDNQTSDRPVQTLILEQGPRPEASRTRHIFDFNPQQMWELYYLL